MLVFKAMQASVEDDLTEVVPSKAPVTHEKLWVEKYAPSSFTELLSDEKTNREVVYPLSIILCFQLLLVFNHDFSHLFSDLCLIYTRFSFG